MPIRTPRILPAFALATLLRAAAVMFALGHGAAFAQEAYRWSVQSIVDNSQLVFGRAQNVFPRAIRGLAITRDGRYLYASYIHSFGDSGEVRKIDTQKDDFERAVVAVAKGVRCKALSVDDDGRVYMACGEAIHIYDAKLTTRLFSIPMNMCDGVAATREGSTPVLYATERLQQQVNRMVLQVRGMEVLGATPSGFPSGNGEVDIPDVRSPRGIAVAPDGRIWIADLDGNKVIRMNRDGTDPMSLTIPQPMAIAFEGDRALISCWSKRQIAIVDTGMQIIGTLEVPWRELELAPFGNNRNGKLSGIAVIPGNRGFYVANESGQTAFQKSTYGKTDASSGFVRGKFFTDSFSDDNEPILRAIPAWPDEVQAAEQPSPTPAATESN